MSYISRRSFLLGAIATTVLPCLPGNAQQSFSPFSFAFVSDIHLTHGVPDGFVLTNESQLFLQDVVAKLNQQKLDFVLFGGDQVHGLGKDEENWQLFLDIAQGLNAPWSFVLGECDIAGSDPVNKMRSFGPDWRGRGIETDAPYWSHSPLPGVHLIGLDTSQPGSTSGYVDAQQLAWLKNDLQKNADKFTVLVSHHPILNPPPFRAAQEQLTDYLLPNGQEVFDAIYAANSVNMALSAHLYVNQLGRGGKTWFITNPGLVTYPCAYKIFHVTPENITMETHQVSFPALIKKAQDLLYTYPLAKRIAMPKGTNFMMYAKGKDSSWNSTLPVDAYEQLSKVKKKKDKNADG